MIAALRELVRFAPGSARQNWASIPREDMRYPKEMLLSVIEEVIPIQQRSAHIGLAPGEATR
jgi:hypothetical protein